MSRTCVLLLGTLLGSPGGSVAVDFQDSQSIPEYVVKAGFLYNFAKYVDWPVDAHEWTAGASGFGARLLLHWLELREPLAGVL